MIRHYTKWDDLPGSVPAAEEALLRAHLIARTSRWGPTYVCLDSGVQEAKYQPTRPAPDVSRYRAPAPPVPHVELIEQAAELLATAKSPVILMGRVSRSLDLWNQRIALAEHLGAAVLTDLRTAASFPTDHALHAAPAGLYPRPELLARLRVADVVLSLDWVDLAGAIAHAWPDRPCPAKIVQVSIDQFIHNGWSQDHLGLPPVDLALLGDPNATVPLLLNALRKYPRNPRMLPPMASEPDIPPDPNQITMPSLAAALRAATRGVTSRSRAYP